MRRWAVAAAPRAGAVCAASAALWGMLCLVAALVQTVTVYDSAGDVFTIRSAAVETAEVLAMTGVETADGDSVIVEETAEGLAIFVGRAFAVSVLADGREIEMEANGGTVEELLARAGVRLGADDEVTPALDTEVREEMGPVRVTRVAYREKTVARRVPYTVEYRDDTEVTEGKYLHEELFQTGRDGLVDTVWRMRYCDGRYAGSELADSVVREEMMPEIHRTYRTNAISLVPAPEGITVENNVPSSYTTVYSMRSTGYWSPRGRGASGLGLYCGTFACNPDVIPYGTKVYVTSEDGSFVYGWAIATDTGTFAITNPMQIDLFYESYAESAAHGVKQVNVYIP